MGGKILLGLCSLFTLSLGPTASPAPPPRVALTVVMNAPGDGAGRYLAFAAVGPVARATAGVRSPTAVMRRLRREEPAIRHRLDRLLAAEGARYRAHVMVKRQVLAPRRRIPALFVRLGRGRGGVWRGELDPLRERTPRLSGGRLRVNWNLPRFLRHLGRLI